MPGRPGMPSRFLSFHNAHAALFEYYHGPERKVYIDPRLEVAGADLFRRYTALDESDRRTMAWMGSRAGRDGAPVILLDHLYNSEIGATLFQSDHWRCVWFDAIAAVFVHDSYGSEVRADTVDFADRHFRTDGKRQSRDRAELLRLEQGDCKVRDVSSARPGRENTFARMARFGRHARALAARTWTRLKAGPIWA